jgi:hypothetical protein
MRVLYREVKLTGKTGKIERSADALQDNILLFPTSRQPLPFERRQMVSVIYAD